MADQWYYTREGRQMEPVTGVELKRLARSGQLQPSDLIWKEGMEQWVPASSAKPLFLDQRSIGITPVPPAPKSSAYSKPSEPAAGGYGVEEEPVRAERLDPEVDQEDDFEDRPRRHGRKQAPALSGGAVIGLLVGGGVLLVGLVVGGLLLFGGARQENARAGGEEVIDAVTLVREYQTDRSRADQKFKGKFILVQGPVRFNKDNTLHMETDLPSILPGAPAGVTDMVLARFANGKEIASVQVGAVVQVKGRCTGFNFELDVELHDCQFIKKIGQLPANQPPKDFPVQKKPPRFDPPVNPPINPPINPPDGFTEVLNIQGKLSVKDPLDRERKTSHHKVHPFKMSAGKTYIIDMESRMDSYLRLEDSDGKQLAFDDDSGGNLNARITFRAERDGEYRIIATTFIPRQIGSYTLKVRQGP